MALVQRRLLIGFVLLVLFFGYGLPLAAQSETATASENDQAEQTLLANIRQAVSPLSGPADEYRSLLESVDDAKIVLIGEASHGTHEFYQARAQITEKLITEKGFTAVAVEADWPAAYRVNRYVRGTSVDKTPEAALSDFAGYPTWMWRNTDVLNFVGWLRTHNDQLPASAAKAGFYGLDFYSLYDSIDEVIAYLDVVDPVAAHLAQSSTRYGCFKAYSEPDVYGQAASSHPERSCQAAATAQLDDLQSHAAGYVNSNDPSSVEMYFHAVQNARVVKDAENYYRSMFDAGVSSWNLRDTHMAATVDALLEHLERQQGQAKIVVWAHNSHLGNASATEVSEQGEFNIGQLVREKYGNQVFGIGFSTYTGSVTASTDWGGDPEHKSLNPGLPGSYEHLFHQVQIPCFLINLRGDNTVAAGLREQRLERAVGVIYRPESERWSHYFYARLADQFDAVIYFDQTQGVVPLEPGKQWTARQQPDLSLSCQLVL
jgi:erythromycin esterase-like protein